MSIYLCLDIFVSLCCTSTIVIANEEYIYIFWNICLFVDMKLCYSYVWFSFFQIYRHGDRTPIEPYPTDPYKKDHWPEGLGQLTKVSLWIEIFKFYGMRCNDVTCQMVHSITALISFRMRIDYRHGNYLSRFHDSFFLFKAPMLFMHVVHESASLYASNNGDTNI